MKAIKMFLTGLILTILLACQVSAWDNTAEYLRAVDVNIVPSTASTYNLGSAAKPFSNVYVDTISGAAASLWEGADPVIYYTGGNVGIGSVNPQHELVVANAIATRIYVGGASAAATFITSNEIDSHVAMQMYANDNTSYIASSGDSVSLANMGRVRVGEAAAGLVIGSGGTADPIIFTVEDTEKMRVAGTGYVGIGTTAPQGMLDVDGAVYVNTIDFGATVKMCNTVECLYQAVTDLEAANGGKIIMTPGQYLLTRTLAIAGTKPIWIDCMSSGYATTASACRIGTNTDTFHAITIGNTANVHTDNGVNEYIKLSNLYVRNLAGTKTYDGVQILNKNFVTLVDVSIVNFANNLYIGSNHASYTLTYYNVFDRLMVSGAGACNIKMETSGAGAITSQYFSNLISQPVGVGAVHLCVDDGSTGTLSSNYFSNAYFDETGEDMIVTTGGPDYFEFINCDFDGNGPGTQAITLDSGTNGWKFKNTLFWGDVTDLGTNNIIENGSAIYSNSAQHYYFPTLTIQGNVGIGTVTSNSSLQVDGAIYQQAGKALFGLNSGNVGIGTGTPTAKFEVRNNTAGTFYDQKLSSDGGYLVRFYESNTTGSRLYLYDGGGIVKAQFGTEDGMDTFMAYATAGNVANVGIGTLTPSAKMVIGNPVATTMTSAPGVLDSLWVVGSVEADKGIYADAGIYLGSGKAAVVGGLVGVTKTCSSPTSIVITGGVITNCN